MFMLKSTFLHWRKESDAAFKKLEDELIRERESKMFWYNESRLADNQIAKQSLYIEQLKKRRANGKFASKLDIESWNGA